YLFNGKELDRETNLTNFGARYLDMKTSLWLNVDPLAEETPHVSPYAFCNNNPLFFTDPTGMSAEPPTEGIPQYIDDSGTYFWDQEKGNYWNSTKGEEYKVTSESKSKGDATYIFNGEGGIQGGFTLTPDRPDYDGIVTDTEARKWWNSKTGGTLYIDKSKLDLSPLTTESFDGDKPLQYNFFTSLSSDTRTARVHGTLTMKLKNATSGEVGFFTDQKGFFDTYDFNGDGRVIRDLTTWGARQIVGEGKGYGFKAYGKNPTVPIK
ncbi:TPA: RHS repeat-associated core domain-containing protein, partial [Flavobacterium psychrophilum]